jgi:transcriptional regulator with XRE-family HTH domain
MAPTKNLGDVVRDARQKKGMSLRQLGERLRKDDGSTMSPQYLNDIEHGRRNPPDEPILRQLAGVLDLDANTLCALAGREPKDVKKYLAEMPEQSEVVGRLFRVARQHGFSDWAALEKEIERKAKKP